MQQNSDIATPIIDHEKIDETTPETQNLIDPSIHKPTFKEKFKKTSYRVFKFLIDQNPLYFSIIYFFCCLYWNCLCQVYVQREYEQTHGRQQPLKDFGFKIFPHIKVHHLVDYWIFGMLGLTILRLLFTGWKLLMIFRRFMFIYGTVWLLRAFSIVLTVLPNPLEQCKAILHPNPFVAAWLLVFDINHTCADVFFSGHAVGITLFVLFWQRYTKHWFFKIIMWILWVAGCFLIIATHYHYTIDVIFGVAIAVFFWESVHRTLENPKYRRWDIIQWFDFDYNPTAEKTIQEVKYEKYASQTKEEEPSDKV